MKVVVLCGGKGTRLREESEFKPKPLVEVGGRPILWHIMKLYAHHGFREFVMCLGYKGDMIKKYFLDYDALNNDVAIRLGHEQKVECLGSHEEQNFSVILADTGLDTLTGGRIKRIEKYIDDDTFMVTYGDGVSNVDVTRLLSFHHAHGKMATVTIVRPTSRFGVLEIDSSHRVRSFSEKPQSDGWVNAGFFVFNRDVLDYLNIDESCALEGEPLRALADAGQMMAYKHDGFFFAMDTYREYLRLNALWESGEAPWAVWSEPARTPVAYAG
jgi:glucose-1-phosphate cytidylyltransferase